GSSSLAFQGEHDVLSRRSGGSAAATLSRSRLLFRRITGRNSGCRHTANGSAASTGGRRLNETWGEQTGPGGDRNNDELPAFNLIGCRHPFRRSSELHRPHLSTAVAIVGAEPAIGSGGEEDQAARRRQRSAAREVRAGVRWNPQLRRGEHRAGRNPPLDFSRIQVVRGHLRPRWAGGA